MSARPSKQPRMVRTFLKVYMERGSYFLFLQEQVKDIIIMTSIIECVRERVLRDARTFLVKVKAHRGEPLNERADTQAENARQLPSECRQWTTRTQRMTYE